MSEYTIHIGDCLDVMRGMADNSIDAIVTDPPYGISFMNRKWDYDVPSVDVWREALRMLKPGGHMLAFGGSRTYHRLVVNIEDAGFEIRDTVMWIYGSGFPKSLDVSKAIDAAQWQGWGTALKPAHEPIVLARKPFDGTVAANVLEWGTGALNVDECRVGNSSTPRKDPRNGNLVKAHLEMRPWMKRRIANGEPLKGDFLGNQGRWPANVIHDGSEEVLRLFPVTTSGDRNGTYNGKLFGEVYEARKGKPVKPTVGDTGSAARFFYCAKASRRERNEGLEDGQSNHHPTVKPTELLRYLCRLITPPGGTVLDPFVGSGSTGKAAMLEGFDFVGIEINPEYAAIARARIGYVVAERTFGLVSD